MNMTQLGVALQYAVTFGAAFLAGRGYMDRSTATELLTWLAAGVPVLISLYKSRDAGKIDAAAKVKGVTVVAPDAVANASTKANVVPASSNEVKPK
jgi:hypothetical protein